MLAKLHIDETQLVEIMPVFKAVQDQLKTVAAGKPAAHPAAAILASITAFDAPVADSVMQELQNLEATLPALQAAADAYKDNFTNLLAAQEMDADEIASALASSKKYAAKNAAVAGVTSKVALLRAANIAAALQAIGVGGQQRKMSTSTAAKPVDPNAPATSVVLSTDGKINSFDVVTGAYYMYCGKKTPASYVYVADGLRGVHIANDGKILNDSCKTGSAYSVATNFYVYNTRSAETFVEWRRQGCPNTLPTAAPDGGPQKMNQGYPRQYAVPVAETDVPEIVRAAVKRA